MMATSDHKPPDICPTWYRAMLDTKPELELQPTMYFSEQDEVTGIMSADVIDKLCDACFFDEPVLLELELEDLTDEAISE